MKTENLSVGYEHPILTDISIYCEKGELIALIGNNGSGKSTLLRTLSGLQNKLSGKVYINDRDIQQLHVKERAKLISFASANTIISNISVFEAVSLGRYPYTGVFGKLSSSDVSIINDVIEKTDLNKLVKKKLYEISDGERQKVMIARALTQNADLIILDEPTAYLDIQNRYEIMILLKKITKNENKCILFSSHDLNIVLQLSHKILLINDKEIIQGAPEDIIINKTIEKLLDFENIEFNYQTGDFTRTRNKTRDIGISGNGLAFEWTVKALEREGINCICNNFDIDYVIIEESEKDLYKWVYHNLTNEYVFNTIYDLIKHIINN
ncbi:MAG: ABC transporter ATP-binding protein [Bacteroidota bacterium]